MYTKNNIAIGKVASKDIRRPELSCIAFYGDRTVATDSFRLIEMSADGKKQKKPTLLYAKEVMQRTKLMNELLNVDDIQKKAMVNPLDDLIVYPDIDLVLDQAERNDHIVIKVNGKYLAECAQILSKLSKFSSIEMYIPKEDGRPIILKSSNETQSARALIMPMTK